MQTMITKFYLERKGEVINMIFPAPQRHRVNTYAVSKRRKYSHLEPVHTPWHVLPIGKQTAREIAQAMKTNQLKGEITFWANDDWFMTVQETS